MIPILDLREQYQALKTEIDTAVAGVLSGGSFIMGQNVRKFELEIAAYLGVKHAVSMNSGTDALHLALRALNIGPGDEVITTPFTFIATCEAISIVGAKPVFVDIDPETLNIDAAQIEHAITKRTRAIMPVHLYGAPADMPAIMSIAQRHRLRVVEDCAQAIGGDIDGAKVGSIGDVGCFSFFPSKNLGAYGDGGLACTNEDALAERLRALRVHGGKVKYHHDEIGINSRLDEMQAAILRVKLPHLESWNRARRIVASRYSDAFRHFPGIRIQRERPNSRHVFHQYTVRVRERDSVRDELARAGIQTMVYYPVPLHLQRACQDSDSTFASFPESEAAAAEVLSLPMYPELTESAQKTVIDKLGEVVEALTVA